MHRDVRHVHGTLQLVVQLLRQQREKLHLVGRRSLLLPRVGVLQVPLNPNRQLVIHLVPLHVAPELPELLGSLLLHPAQLRQRARNAANEVGETDEREDDDQNRPGALDGVLRLHVHGGGGELRDGPMERSQVLRAPVHLLKTMLQDPARLLIARAGAVAHQEPKTCDEVVDAQQQRDHLYDVGDDAGGLGVQEVIDDGQDPAELEQAQQADRPRESEDAEQLHGFSIRVLVAAGQLEHREHPVWNNDNEVDPEPEPNVVAQDLHGGHDHHAVVDVTHQHRRQHV
mmetsp:Transcript_19929/g.53549  ORF Transcript_19929/g.53549 Transcript_19929/m.53549 type:complete len:285 (+) Transcript_19929:667-1521(+)